jgi:serine protease Do
MGYLSPRMGTITLRGGELGRASIQAAPALEGPAPLASRAFPSRIFPTARSALSIAVLLASICCMTMRAFAERETSAVFAANSEQVYQVKVVERESGAKAGIGSAFSVTDVGHVMTNFHVVSSLIDHPDRYRGELVDSAGNVTKLEVVHFDVIHDLAILHADLDTHPSFRFRRGAIEQGTRIYSLGNPFDLGMVIVEGTYNGLLEHSHHARIHFTGSLNAGMSGGPAILETGEVVGVNVATSGNQVSFLVPVERASLLVEQVLADGFRAPRDFMPELAYQLLAYQDGYLEELEGQSFELVAMGKYRAPTRLAPHFNCWGNATHAEEALHRSITHRCYTHDNIYLSEDHNFSPIRLRHRQVESDELNPVQFYNMYSNFFEGNHSQFWGQKKNFTPFRCRTKFVDNGGLTFKTVFCVRRYRKLTGVFDAVFKAAALGDPRGGFETALVLSAVSFENAERLAQRYLEAIQWRE